MSGWVKLHRSFLDWEWYDDSNTSRLFLYCLLKANHRDKEWRGKTIKRGTFLTSLRSLSKGTGLSIKKIRVSLKRLESTGEVAHKRAQKGTILTICNYDTYQDLESEEGTQDGRERASKGHRKGTERAHTKNDKNEKNIRSSNISFADGSDSETEEKKKPEIPFEKLPRAKRIRYDYETGELSGILEKDLQEWKEAYPGVDIATEIMRAKMWLGDNPSNRKKAISRFLSNWLSRNKGGSPQGFKSPQNQNHQGDYHSRLIQEAEQKLDIFEQKGVGHGC